MKRALDTPPWAALDTSALDNGYEDYDIDSRTPDAAGLLADFQRRSDEARAHTGIRRASISYAEHPLALADVFRPDQGSVKGTVVFIHGGYWKGKGRPNRAFLAPAWVDAGVQWINLGYPVAPETPMPDIARLTRTALRDIVGGASPFEMVEGPVVLAGNSAGAHLVAHALAELLSVQAPRRIAGCLLLSGLYDLRPLLDTPAQQWMRLDEEQAYLLSPLCQSPPRLHAPIMVAVGADEPDAFIAQSRAYAQSMLGYASVDYQEVQGLNHLTMISALDSPTARLGRVMASWLGIDKGPAC
ncbi:alpha/beta hydrolase [Pusillimonas sp.]|uniref:alpha/beta hydrolase n=1 Tax=Pusillimonas sp. TaxID=3040095 RepID=UPI0037C75AAA